MTSDSGLVVGIDVGTQGVRVQIADSVGRVVAQVSHSVPSQLSADGWFEQDPDHWWRAAAHASGSWRCSHSSLGRPNEASKR